ncbi:MAG: T9SS type A sorting domain-containing protein, partial [Chitinophagaceae bacterium]
DCKDLISKPVFNTSNFSICGNDSLKLTISNVNKGDTLKWFYGTKSDITNVTSKTFNDVTSLFVTRTDSIGCVSSSDTVQIKKFNLPAAPTISRDTANNLVSSVAFNNTWYKDAKAITDTTQKIKPSGAGSYTVTTTENGCASKISNAYYYLVTDIIKLSTEEFIKLAPNPFQGQLNFDFNVKAYQKLNVEVFELTTGTRRTSQQNVLPGSILSFGYLAPGTYIIKVSSNDQKLSHQFKMIKL